MTSIDQETLEVNATGDEQPVSMGAVRPLVTGSQTSGGCSNHTSFGQPHSFSLSDVHGPQVSQASNQAMSISSVKPPSMGSVRPSVGSDQASGGGNKRRKEIKLTTMDNPGVFTKEDGPGGRIINGILCEYGKGEEVKIMCVCHGSLLTAAEFVKHAGRNNADQPLKYIAFGRCHRKRRATIPCTP